MEFTSRNAREFKGMSSVTIPKGYTSMRSWSFAKNEDLISIVIPPDIKAIGEGAFSNCKNLKSITIQGAVGIDKLAFAECTSLQEIVFPDSVQWIDEGVFRDCINLKRITLSSKLEKCDRLFPKCNLLEYVIYPEGVTEITGRPFYGCTSPSLNIVLPNSIEYIEPKVFYDLSKIKIICQAGSYAETYCKQNGITTSDSVSEMTLDEPVIKSADTGNSLTKGMMIPSAILYAIICAIIGVLIWDWDVLVPSLIVGAILGVIIYKKNS